nr:formate/nitrite transporter family protein [Tepidimonas aquatica]
MATPARPGRRFLFSGTCYAPASGIQIGADHSIKGVAPSQWLGGLVFALGLLLVVAGAELFTGNNLLAMAWADGRISTREVLRNWGWVCLANGLGAAGLAVLVQAGGGAPAAPPVTFSGMLGNLVPVIGGNLLGGSVVVGLTYHVIYRRGSAS